eukprot:m.290643 g.290643  ORF g.290643 m.290643 type:complete len:658 (-) comp19469_c3_seq1:192-2165(-)
MASATNSNNAFLDEMAGLQSLPSASFSWTRNLPSSIKSRGYRFFSMSNLSPHLFNSKAFLISSNVGSLTAFSFEILRPSGSVLLALMYTAIKHTQRARSEGSVVRCAMIAAPTSNASTEPCHLLSAKHVRRTTENHTDTRTTNSPLAVGIRQQQQQPPATTTSQPAKWRQRPRWLMSKIVSTTEIFCCAACVLPSSRDLASQNPTKQPTQATCCTMPQPTYTWEELSKHNTPDNVLVAVHGKVYDVTEFLNQHPGGRLQLELGAGRDVSEVFDSYHKESTHKFIEKFYVGELVSNELVTFPPTSEFGRVLRERIKKHFVDRGQDPKHVPWMWARYVMIMLTMAVGLYLQFTSVRSCYMLAALGTVLSGIAAAMIGLMPLHDASHHAVTHNPTVWRWLGSLHDFVNGASSRMWSYQHMIGHHSYTNIDGADPDVDTNEKDIRRIKETQEWFPWYIPQHIYVPVLYSLLALKTRMQDFAMYFAGTNGTIRINPFDATDKFIFFGGKSFFVFYRIILPALFLSWTESILLLAVSDIVTSLWLALSFQASHVTTEVEWPMPDDKGLVDMDWYKLQIETTVDYATSSWLWSFLTGALNHQTTHHVFPGVNQFYYRDITPVVAKTCREFGVQYRCKDTFSAALGQHLQHLENLGRRPEEKKAQ